ncbi:hypothetical protein RNJ44_03610 [Nakaseomyces bracarensis]|uniref:AN1-type domain-containing protein n=1 Tax=Nakaseomyces bracarensis TaxID=273131 RepID=A0ABR4NXF6_9SACH
MTNANTMYNTKEEDIRVEEDKKSVEKVEGILNGDREDSSQVGTPVLLRQLSTNSLRISGSISPVPSISSQNSSASAVNASTSTKVSKKSSGLKKKKKKKNQCYHDKCSSTASKFIGDCNFCKGHFCSRHRLMENHACSGLTSCKEQMHQRNADKLESEQTHAQKIRI